MHQSTSLWLSYWRALHPRTFDLVAAQQHSPVVLRAEKLKTDPIKLKRYKKIIDDNTSDCLPLCWPNILTFPQQLAALTAPTLPLSVMGLLHVRNEIKQFKRIPQEATLDVEVTLLTPQRCSKGLLLIVQTSAYWQGMLCWQQQAEHLYRLPETSKIHTTSVSDPFLASTWQPGPPLGAFEVQQTRRYAWLSGDLNPIHLGHLSAKCFGLPAAIAHGMHMKACAIAKLTLPDEVMRVSLQFQKPLTLPGRVTLWRQQEGELQHFALQDRVTNKVLLQGQVSAI